MCRGLALKRKRFPFPKRLGVNGDKIRCSFLSEPPLPPACADPHPLFVVVPCLPCMLTRHSSLVLLCFVSSADRRCFEAAVALPFVSLPILLRVRHSLRTAAWDESKPQLYSCVSSDCLRRGVSLRCSPDYLGLSDASSAPRTFLRHVLFTFSRCRRRRSRCYSVPSRTSGVLDCVGMCSAVQCSAQHSTPKGTVLFALGWFDVFFFWFRTCCCCSRHRRSVDGCYLHLLTNITTTTSRKKNREDIWVERMCQSPSHLPHSAHFFVS